MIKTWYIDLRCVRTSTSDTKRSERIIKDATHETNKTIPRYGLANRRLAV